MIFNSAHTGPHLERANGRNGCRERLWEARAGSVGLKIPKLCKSSYFPGFPKPHRTVQKPYIQGVSTWCSPGLVRWSSGNCQ